MPAIIAAGIGVGGSILGGLIGGAGAQKAAAEEAAAINNATKAELQMYNQTVAREQPWVTAGTNALSDYQKLLGLGPGGTGTANTAGFTGSPGYQFELGQGTQAIANQATLSGGPNSGNALKALQTYGTGLANQDWYNYLAQVSGLSGQGASAAANLGSIGTSVGNQIGSNAIAGGQANAAGTVGATNSLIGGVNGVAQNALLYALLNGSGGASSGGSGVLSPYSSSMSNPSAYTTLADYTGYSGGSVPTLSPGSF